MPERRSETVKDPPCAAVALKEIVDPLTSTLPLQYTPAMEQFFLCACCGEENDITIDQLEGENQEFVQDCAVCCRPNVIIARFNYHTNEFDLEVYQEDVG